MSAFNFSLQRVLDLRVHERRKAEQTLAAVRERRRELETQLRQVRRGFEASLQTHRSDASNVTTLRRQAAHREATREKRRELTDQLEQIREREEIARRKLIEKRRAEETLGSLHEDERRTHVERKNRLNQQLLDEQAISQHIRQNPLRS
jgi:flagellar FliJ protein